MKILRWASVVLLIVYLLFAFEGSLRTFQLSQKSIVHQWSPAELLLSLGLVLARVAVIATALLRGRRASLLLQIVALVVAILAVGRLLPFALGYVDKLGRPGYGIYTAHVLSDFLSGLFPIGVLTADLRSRRRDRVGPESG